MSEKMQDRSIINFLQLFFENFKRIFISNILFSIPSAIIVSILYFINKTFLSPNTNIIILGLSIFLCYPFYGGVTQVVRDIITEQEKESTFKTFVKGLKENWKSFLLHGLFIYLGLLISLYSGFFYYALAKTNSIGYFFLGFCILIFLAILFMSFYLPIMSVSFNLKLKDIYKNSALMTFGEFKNNIFALISIIIIGAFLSGLFILSTSINLITTIVILLLLLLVIPGTMSFCINYFVYYGMANIILSKDEKAKEIQRKIDAKRSGKKDEDEKEDLVKAFSNINIEEEKKSDGDEYIFKDGKMVKRSVLIKEIEKLNSNEEETLKNHENDKK